ncbi:MAG TPA: hypothetical protein PLH91_08070, partial [Tenuifilaceae bacterium]|nr:hypothetical protein [Tenuifilaceae bacterium]
MRTKIINVAFVVLALGLYSCADNNYKVQSQSGKLVLNFALIGETQPSYCVYYDGKQIIKPST